MKKYSFKVTTVKILSDENSPYELVKIEFLASNLKSAEDYKNSLLEHYKSNRPFVPNWPWEVTELIEDIL